MAVRLIVKIPTSKQISPDDFAVCNKYQTFVIDHPELESLLCDKEPMASIIGAEYVASKLKGGE